MQNNSLNIGSTSDVSIFFCQLDDSLNYFYHTILILKADYHPKVDAVYIGKIEFTSDTEFDCDEATDLLVNYKG